MDLTNGNLHQLLGFKSKILDQENQAGEYIANITHGIHDIYIQCDIVKGSLINNCDSDVIHSFVSKIPHGGGNINLQLKITDKNGAPIGNRKATFVNGGAYYPLFDDEMKEGPIGPPGIGFKLTDNGKQALSEDFIREFQDKVNWVNITGKQALSEHFIREFQDKVNWVNISGKQALSEDFIREFQDKINWGNISEYQKLNEDFIREFKDKVDWVCISKYQKISEDFIREFKDTVNWYCISEYQKLS
ncbi:uncharacterized protein CEXT_484971 [Caerostris extrusa]|uniref:Uncharacterized protein n=1 Tax=Caerostris extrusa TaxID=172846 RepID=A0AAV4SJL4_CAEEX|nr:uncharacterized protein CEXT_484971 [Caerostris extrusa]